MANDFLYNDPTVPIESQDANGDWFAVNAPPANAQADVAALAQKYRIGAGETDVANLAAKNPEDRAAFLAALDAQYAQRAMPTAQAPGQMGASAPSGGTSDAPLWMQPFTDKFQAPTSAEVQGSQPFQFRLGEAINAVSRAGLAKGTFFTNQTAKALQEQASGIASDEYGKAYDRKLNEYGLNANIFNQNETNRFSSQRANRLDTQGILSDNRQFDRTLTNDQWGRGTDVWNMNRTSNNDQFTQGMTLAEFLQRYRPQPA